MNHLSKTPLTNIDEKLDIIEHINQDHTEEVLAIVVDKYKQLAVKSAKIADIFVEGMTVDAVLEDNSQQELFIAFELQGELEEQILYLAYLAMSKQGKDLSGNKKSYFEVMAKQQITTNITRLTLKSASALPTDYAGFAYGMVLKTLNKTPDIKSTATKPHGLLKKMGNQAFLWGLKKMSSERRQKMVESMNKGIRLYTLRKAWTEGNEHFGYMDIFTHITDSGKSDGTKWVESLDIGDVVFSRSEAKDKHSHLKTGKCVLIADETAYPAVAGIIELWENEQLPTLITISANNTEQDYFSDKHMSLPEGIQVHRIVSNHFANNTTQQSEVAEQVIATLAELPEIDAVWGGLENQCAKKVRHYLRNERNLTGKTNHVKAYWRMK